MRLQNPYLLAAIGLALCTPIVRAQAPRELVEAALDQPVEEIVLNERPIREALREIEQRTGLRFELSDDVINLMPFGHQTQIAVEIRRLSVRQGLTQIFDGLGLCMEVQSDRVVVLPAAWTARLGRRMKLEEATQIERLSRLPWKALLDAERPQLDFRGAIPGGVSPAAFEQSLAGGAERNGLAQLEGATRSHGLVWWPEEGRLVVAQRSEDVRRRLDWALDMTYQREPLDRLLVDLGRRVGVTFLFEPGALQRVNARDCVLDIVQRGVSVRQTLERICGNTGLRYDIIDDGVKIFGPATASGAGGPTAADITRWVRIEVEIKPGVKMDVFVPEDRLPPELRELAQRKVEEILSGSGPGVGAGAGGSQKPQ